MRIFRFQVRAMNSATAGLELARDVLCCLRSDESVLIDLEAVERVTPSFANALIMTLLAEIPRVELAARAPIVNASPSVAQSLAESARRYEAGIRLSSQRAISA